MHRQGKPMGHGDASCRTSHKDTKTQRDGEMKGSDSGKIFVHVVFESIGWGKENKLIIIDPPILL